MPQLLWPPHARPRLAHFAKMSLPRVFILVLLLSVACAQDGNDGVTGQDLQASPSPKPPGASPSPSGDNPPPESPTPDPSPTPTPSNQSPTPSPNPEPTPSPTDTPIPTEGPVPVPSPPVPSPPPPSDPRADALLIFKSKISNANDIPAFNSWVAGGNPCTFEGVGCDGGGVIRNLSLTQKGMAGSLSDALTYGALSSFQFIDLGGNQLGGIIPDAYNGQDVLPELQYLSLTSNQLTGGPTGLGTSGCKNLQQLQVDSNNFKSFPADWSFAAMSLLAIQNNLINDTVPASWSSVVPSGKTVIIMPQKANARVCGSLPKGGSITWAQSVNGQTTAITNDLSPCGPSPPPMMSPPPAAPAPLTAPPPLARTPPPAILSPPAAKKSGMSTGVIIAIAVGGIVGLIVIAALVYWCCRPKKNGPAGKGDLDAAEAGYYTSDGKWVSSNPHMSGVSGNGALLAGGAGGLATIATHRRTGSNTSGIGQSIGSTPQNTASFDPLLEWAQRQPGLSEADLAAAVAAGNSPRHGQQQSKGGSNLPMDVKMWTLNFRDLQLDKQIGEGSFGRVYLGWWNETPVAVKMLLGVTNNDEVDSNEAAMSLSSPMLEGLAKESSMMAALRHPNVVGFLGICLNPPCIVTEYCSRGSMTDVLRGGKSSPAKAALLDWNKRLNMALDAAKGMLYLHAHSPPIIHRDLKSPNLLVDKHWRVKVSDFNLSKLMEEGSVMSSMAATNPRWLAPEILTGNNATFASDVYSYAIVMWELLTWDLPWGPTNPWQVVTVVTEGGRLEVPAREILPGPDTNDFEELDGYVALMRRCWAHNPDDRPTFQEIISELRDLLKSRTKAIKAGYRPPSDIDTPIRGTPPTSQAVEMPIGDGSGSYDGSRALRNPGTPSPGSVPGPAEGVSPTGLDRGDSLDVDFSPPGSDYASTAGITGSLANMDDLQSGWGSKFGSKYNSKPKK